MKRIVWLLLLSCIFSLALTAQSREQIYQLGKKSFQDQLYTESIKHLKDFMDLYSSDPRNDSALYMIGVSWYYLRNYPSAQSALQQLELQFKSSPYLVRSAYWLGLIHYSAGQFEDAVAQFERQLNYSQDAYYYDRSLLYLGLSEEKRLNWQNAAQWYLRLEEESRNEALLSQAYFRAGLSMMQLQQYSDALRQFQFLSMTFSSNPVGRDLPFYTAVCYTHLGDYEEANRRFHSYLQLNGRGELREKTLLYIAQNAYSSGKLLESEAALETLTTEFSRGTQYIPALKMLISMSMEREEWGKAEQWLTRLNEVSTSPEDRVKVAYSLAELLYQQKRFDEALTYADLVIGQGNEEQKRAMAILKAHLLRELGDTQGAMAAYKAYWDQYPQSPDAIEAGRWLISLYREQNRLDELQQIVDTMLEQFPEDGDRPAFYYIKGEFLQDLGNSGEALEWFNRLLTQFPESEYAAHGLYRIGYIYAQRSEHQRASQYYRRLLKDYPDSELRKDALYSLSLSLYQGDSYQMALPVMIQYLQEYPQDSRGGEIAYTIGDVYYSQGLYDSALQYFEAAQTAYGSEEGARSLYMQGMCQMQREYWDDAQQRFADLYDRYPSNSWAIEGLYMSGVAAWTNKQFDRAKEQLLLASRLSSGGLKEKTAYMLAQVYLDLDQKDQCIQLLDEIRIEYPEGDLIANFIYRQGEQAFSQEDYQSARQWFQLCVNHYPSHELAEQAQLRMIRSRLELLEYSEVREDLLTYLDLYPETLYAAQAAVSFSDAMDTIDSPGDAEQFYRQVEEKTGSEIILSQLYLGALSLGGFAEDSTDKLEELYNNENLPEMVRNRALLLLAQRKEKSGAFDEAAELYRVLISNDSGNVGSEAQFALARSLSFYDKLDGANEFMNLFYLFPDQGELVAEALFRAWQLYAQLEDQGQKAEVAAEKLQQEYPLSVWTEKLNFFIGNE